MALLATVLKTGQIRVKMALFWPYVLKMGSKDYRFSLKQAKTPLLANIPQKGVFWGIWAILVHLGQKVKIALLAVYAQNSPFGRICSNRPKTGSKWPYFGHMCSKWAQKTTDLA